MDYNIYTELTMKQAMDYCYNVACYYPKYGRSDFINSNVDCQHCVNCCDGYFFCESVDSSIPHNYIFKSPTLDLLYEKQINIEYPDDDFKDNY